MRDLSKRLARLEADAAFAPNSEERIRLLRLGLARIGINYSGNFAATVDPNDKRTPAEKLRDFLEARKSTEKQRA